MGRRVLACCGLALVAVQMLPLPGLSVVHAHVREQRRTREPIQPIPTGTSPDPAKVALGEALFHEPKLSRDDSISCASCHSLATGGVDRRPHAVGVGGAESDVNAPTVFNSVFNFRQLWDGRAETLESQIGFPVESPKEMGATWPSSCHQGIGVGGNMFQSFGVIADYFADRGNVRSPDLGRFNVTGRESDRFVFKVPELRLAVLTPPYFQDGSAQRIEDAVVVMGKYQLGRNLAAEEVRQIVAFLKTLPGEYKGRPLQ